MLGVLDLRVPKVARELGLRTFPLENEADVGLLNCHEEWNSMASCPGRASGMRRYPPARFLIAEGMLYTRLSYDAIHTRATTPQSNRFKGFNR